MKNNYSTQNETNSKLDIRYSAILAKLRLKSFTLTLAIFVAGIGSLWGQCTSTFTTMLPTTVQNPGATITTNTAKYFAVNVTAGTFYRITSSLQDGCFNIRMGSATGTVIWSARSGSMFQAPSTGVAYVHHSTGACATTSSTTSRTITFIAQTTCTSTAFSSPWNEGFEGLTTAAYGVSAILPCGWAKAGQTGTLNAASISYNDPRTGSNYLTTYYPSTTNTDFIWTRGFNLIAGTSYNFSFYFAGDGTAGWQGDVYTGLNQNAAAATILGSSFVSSATTTTSSYQQVTRTFTPASTGTYYFAIRSQRPTGSTSPWYLGFDDFSLVDITPTCPTLSSPADAASGVSQLPTLSWTAGANSNSYDVYLSTNQTLVNNQDASVRVATNHATTTYSPASLTASTIYYWRVVPKNSLGNAASGCTTRSFTTQAPTPTLTVGSLTAFGNQCVNTTSSAGSFTVSGINLTANVGIAALSGYSYCLTAGGTYTSTLSIPASGTLASTLVYVKFNPTAASAYNGNIVASSTGATSQNVAASGTGLNTTISTQPSSAAATYCSSGTATALTVAATAASGSAFSYQWYSNSSASTSGGTAVGTNAASYTPSTAVNGTLYYYCVVSGCGTATATSTVTGAISTGACINMPTTSGSTTLTGNVNFYDDGGPGGSTTSGSVGNYAATQTANKVFTVSPSSCNNVRVTFNVYALEACACDWLKIYNGNSTSATLIGQYYNTNPGTITSTAADGSLTFEFYTDGSVNSTGWEATLSNVPVTAGPAAPTGFAGTLNAEVGSTQTYSVTAVAGATYAWSFPSGWVINSGQGTNSVSVTVGTVNGNISVTPTRCSLAGTAYTVATTIPNYRWKYVSSNLGSATWTGGEARSIDITIKNTGVATWNTTYPNNIGVRWNSTTGSLSGTPWSDYHVRASVGSLAPGATGTFTLAMEARNSDNALAPATPSLTTNLADGTYYLAFDMVSEGQCWFSNNSGTCGPGNTVFYSAVQTVSTVPTLSCSALTAFGNVCSDATPTNSFTISGVNLTNSVSVGSVTGYTYSTTSNGTYTSTLTLTPSSGSLNQTVYVKFTPTAATAYSGSISVTSTGATGQSVSVSGTGIAAPTVNAGSDVSICSGQTVALSGSTNATSSSGSASATYSAGNASTLYSASPTTATISSCPIPLSVTIPVGAVITGVNVSYTMTAASNGWMADQRSYVRCTNAGGSTESAISSGTGNAIGSLPYSRNNLTIANGVSGGGTINFQLHAFRTYSGTTCTTTDNYVNNNTFIVTVNYTINPTYSWSPSTGLLPSDVLAPNCSATSTTTYTLTVTGTNGCSASDQVVATVAGTAPAAPTASVSGSSTINVGGTTTLTSSAGASTLWYTAASGGSSVGSGDNWQTPVQCAAGTGTYYAEDNNGTCASPSRTAVTFTVRSMVAENPSNGLICTAGGSVTLSAQLTGGTDITWSPNTNLSSTSGASTIASPTATTVYTMNATVAGCGSVSETANVGVIDAVVFTPTSTPASVCAGNPAALASDLSSSGFSALSTTFAMASSSSATPSAAVTLASGGTAIVPTTSTLTALRPLDDAGWANIPIGFVYNFFGNNYTTLNVGTNGNVQFGTYNGSDVGGLGDFQFSNLPNTSEPANIIAAAAVDLNATAGTIKYWTQGIAPTRVFVVEWSGVPGYASNGSNTAQIKLFETTGNVETHIQNSSSSSNKIVGLQNNTIDPNTSNYTGAMPFSNTTTITNQAWKFVPGANYTFQWATAGSNIDGATSTGYTTANLNTPGTVSYSVAAYNPNTQCTTTQSVSITVNALPSAPVSAGNVTECANAANQNLVVSVGLGETADWYAASSGGSILTTPSNGTATTSYSVPANTTATYHAQARNTTTGCISSSRTGVTFTTKPVPTAPTASAVSYCQGATSSPMTASTPVGSNTQNWYDVSTGGTPLAGAPTPSTSTATTLTYYVSEVGTNGCESSRTSVTATINATPSAPSASNPSAYCQNASASALTATAGVGNTLYWYTVPTGGSGSTTAITPSTSTAGNTDYYVAQRSASNCESSRATITVTVNPNITASVSNSASSTSACGGGSITFTATPTNGGASPTYQWYLNGATVGTNSATYELASPANNNEIYVAMTPSAQTCLTSASATNSSTITLTSSASTPTVAIQSSASSAICPGTSVTFSVNSSANMGATPSYVWKLNGSAISGATNSTYTSTGLANDDQITLEMTSSLDGLCVTQPSATSAAITTTVNTATSITSQPSATSACASGTANFTVTGAGQGTLTYQWKKNGANVTGNETSTSATLILSGVGAGDVADYTVDVIGACGTVSSNTAAFTLKTPTSISVDPSAVTTCTNTNANFSVTAAGQGTLSYQWTFGGSPINTATNSSYTATGVTSANAGSYRVIVTGECGALTSNAAALTVQPATVISSQPSASTICQNNTANFAVSATGQGTLSYQWKRDGTNVGTNSSSLAVSNAQSINAGSYTVDVTGSCGTTTSNAAVLTVNPATSITTQPVGTAGCEGQNTTFTVVAAGTGSLSYQWKYGATDVGTNSASYNIPSTTTANDGNYSVVVSGGCGNAPSSSVALNVYPSPSTAVISTADITNATLCGKNEVSVSANAPVVGSTGLWSVVGNWGIVSSGDTEPTTTFTADNAALGGVPKKLVWSHVKVTSGNSCFTRDTITIDFKQPSFTEISTLVQNGDVLWNGLTDASWSTSSNWYQYTVSNSVGRWIRMTSGEPTASTKVYTLSNGNAGVCVNSTNAPALGNGEVASNVYVGDGATLNLSSGTLSIAGDLTNNGTINPSSGTITFNGTGAQKITGTGIVANFNNLIINKASDTLTLEQPAKVAGTLTMTQGDIITDATNILEIGTNASSVGSVSWTSGTVRGPLKRWFNSSANSTQESGIFPVGVASGAKAGTNRYAQVNFTSNPGTGGYIIAQYVNGTPEQAPTGLPLNYSSGSYPQAIQNYEEEGYWDITPYSSSNLAYAALNSASYTLKLRLQNPSTLTTGWTPSNDGNDLYNASTIRMIRAKGSNNHANWELAGTHSSAVETGNGDYYITSTGITEFSWFNGGGNNQNPLPVELVSFTGACDNGLINLTWQTASEFNSSHFDVEKSRDGENWQLLTKISSAGTSNELITYQSTDQNGTEGNNYFRLRQVDVDGTEKVYDPINVSCSEVTTGYFSSFPNPSGSSFQVIVNNKELIGACTLNIVDASGKVIEQREIEVKDGINMFVINQELTPGIYFLNVSNGSKSTPVLRHAIK